jgi:hypothetical protein
VVLKEQRYECTRRSHEDATCLTHIQDLLNSFAAVFSPPVALGYRPFVSTDAAVADLKEMEIELGYFNLERERGRTTFIVPKAVLNYGLIRILSSVANLPLKNLRAVQPGS